MAADEPSGGTDHISVSLSPGSASPKVKHLPIALAYLVRVLTVGLSCCPLSNRLNAALSISARSATSLRESFARSRPGAGT